MIKKMMIGLTAFGLFTAMGANAAMQGNPAQPFEQQVLQARGFAGVDRHECQILKQRQFSLPNHCIAR